MYWKMRDIYFMRGDTDCCWIYVIRANVQLVVRAFIFVLKNALDMCVMITE